MKIFSFILASLFPLLISSMEYEVQFENNDVRVSKWKMESKEEIGWHRNGDPAVVFPLQGGTFTRVDKDGTTREVVYPTGVATPREVDPVGQLHRAINSSDHAIEAIMVEFKAEVKESS